VGVAVVSIANIEAIHSKRRVSSTERTGGVDVDVPIRMNGVDVGKLTGTFTLTSRVHSRVHSSTKRGETG
jgi:hypothetical protein